MVAGDQPHPDPLGLERREHRGRVLPGRVRQPEQADHLQVTRAQLGEGTVITDRGRALPVADRASRHGDHPQPGRRHVLHGAFDLDAGVAARGQQNLRRALDDEFGADQRRRERPPGPERQVRVGGAGVESAFPRGLGHGCVGGVLMVAAVARLGGAGRTGHHLVLGDVAEGVDAAGL